jgi:hypothetical protein
MKKIFTLLISMFLLIGCVESITVIPSGAANGKLAQSSVNSAANYGIKKKTGKTVLQHIIAYGKKRKPAEKKEPCSSFDDKKNQKICLTTKERMNSKEATSSLQHSINERSKINYLD